MQNIASINNAKYGPNKFGPPARPVGAPHATNKK